MFQCASSVRRLCHPFVADDSTGASSNFVTIEQVAVDQGRIRLAIIAHGLTEPVSGLAMKLTYPNAFAKFVDCTDGDLFPPGTCHNAEPDDAGAVFIGRSVTGAGQAVAPDGDRTIVHLEFLVFAEGVDLLVIEGQNLGGGDASALLDANGDPIFVQWYSGALVGQ